jgi:hypothetical protein
MMLLSNQASPCNPRQNNLQTPSAELSSALVDTGLADEDISPLHTMQGLITRAHARQLDLQSRCQRVHVTHNPTGKNHIRGRIWVTLCTHRYVNGEEVIPIGYSGCGYGN